MIDKYKFMCYNKSVGGLGGVIRENFEKFFTNKNCPTGHIIQNKMEEFKWK
jgi:hypothetical protein